MRDKKTATVIPPESPKEAKEKNDVKADEVMKVLFGLSLQPMIDLLNGLFNEELDVDRTTLVPVDPVSIDHFLESKYSDFIINAIEEVDNKQFHVEFQLKNDQSMVVRMFEYGVSAATKRFSKEKNNEEKIVLKFPHQLVIYLERNSSIGDTIACEVLFPNGETLEYEVPVIKIWEITEEEFGNNLYALIPFRVFELRKGMMSILDREISETEKKPLVQQKLQEVKKCYEECQDKLYDLWNRQKINADDLGKMMVATTHLTQHIYKKAIDYDESFAQEVEEKMYAVNLKVIEQTQQNSKLEAIRNFIIMLLNDKGWMDESLEKLINSQQNIQILNEWGLMAAKSNTVDEFRQKICD